MAYWSFVVLILVPHAAGVFLQPSKTLLFNLKTSITSAINNYKSVMSLPNIQLSYFELNANGTSTQLLHGACDAIVNGGIHAVVGASDMTTPSNQFDMLSAVFPFLQVPYVTTASQMSSNPFISDTFPTPRQEALMIFSLMREWGWANAAVVTNFESYGKSALYQLYTLGGKYNFQFETLLAKDETSYHETVSKIDNSIFRLVILWCDCKCVERVLSIANARGLVTTEWAWILSIEATGCAKTLNLEYDGLVGVSPNYEMIYQNFGTTSKLISTSVEPYLVLLKPLLDAGSRIYLQNDQVFPTETIIPSCSGSYKSKIGVQLANAVKTIKKSGQFGPKWQYVNMQQKSWILFAKWSHVDGYKSLSVGVLFPGKTISVSDLQPSLRGKHIWACTHTDSDVGGWKTLWMNKKPSDLLTKKRINDSELGGFQIDLFRTLAKEIGFNYSFTYPRDEQWGSRHPITGEWNGILKELRTGYCDIGAATVTMTRTRHTHFDFTHSIFDTGLTFIMRKPGVRESPFRFMEPFTPRLWGMLVLALFVTGLVIGIINKLSPFEHHGEFVMTPHDMIRTNESRSLRFQFRKFMKEATGRFSFMNSQWFSISSLFQQGFDPPISPSGRLVTCVWWMAVLLFTSTFTANMAAVQTLEVLSSGISSIKDLGDQEDIIYGTMDKSGTIDFFENSDVDLYKKMYARIMKFKESVIMPVDEGIATARRGGYAFIWDKAVLDYEATVAPCELTTVGDPFNMINYAYPLRAGSPFTRELNVHIMQLKAQGILNTLYKKWFFRNSECPQSEDGMSKGLAKMGVKNMLGVFIIIYSCIAGSMIILVIEFYFACRRLIVDKDNDFQSYVRAMVYRLKRIHRDWVMYYKPMKATEARLILRNQALFITNVLQGQKIKTLSKLIKHDKPKTMKATTVVVNANNVDNDNDLVDLF